MKHANRVKLIVLMVMQFFIWGAWLPLIFGYLPSLGFTPAEQAWILSAFPIAAIVGMFFSNQFADRHFAAERFLGFSHLLGGLALLGLGFTRSFWPFLALMFVHCLFYVPTLSIANAIVFAHLKNARRDFGLVRVGGTIGWILAAWPFVFLFVDWNAVQVERPQGFMRWIGTALAHPLTGDAARAATRWTYLVAGAASLSLATFSFALPRTPPTRAGQRGAQRLAWVAAVRLLGHPFVLVLWIVAFIDSFVHYCYFNWTGVFLQSAQVGIPSNWVMPVMSIGQAAEIVTMFVLGAALRKLGWRATMIAGILGHAARFAVYAFFPQHTSLIILVQLLHGVCYAFFFATVYIFVDEYFPNDVRASAQGLFNVMILGVGALAANALCPWLIQVAFNVNGETNFRGLFMVPLIAALVAALLLGLFFHPPQRAWQSDGGNAEAREEDLSHAR